MSHLCDPAHLNKAGSLRRADLGAGLGVLDQHRGWAVGRLTLIPLYIELFR